jgi:hypothetical protein
MPSLRGVLRLSPRPRPRAQTCLRRVVGFAISCFTVKSQFGHTHDQNAILLAFSVQRAEGSIHSQARQHPQRSTGPLTASSKQNGATAKLIVHVHPRTAVLTYENMTPSARPRPAVFQTVPNTFSRHAHDRDVARRARHYTGMRIFESRCHGFRLLNTRYAGLRCFGSWGTSANFWTCRLGGLPGDLHNIRRALLTTWSFRVYTFTLVFLI